MAFSFNWAGLQVPQATFTKAVDDPEFGANLGRAARGYENRAAAKEYARKIDQFRNGRVAAASDKASRIAAIKAEIARLESENASIEQKLNVQPTQQESEPAWSPTEEEMKALMFDPETASKEDIMAMQKLVGAQADGMWGPTSNAAYTAKYGYLWNPGEGNVARF